MENTINQFDNLTLSSSKLKEQETESMEQQVTVITQDLSVGPSFCDPTSERPLLN